MATVENLTNKGKGRPKGSVNKVGAAAKEVIAEVALGLGGPKRMLAWAKEDAKNEAAFWERIYPKLLPLQLTGSNGGPIETVAKFKLADLE